MKYIRTKERIYDTYSKGIQLEKNKITNEIEYYYQSCAFSVPFKLEVLSQADTIEELCDAFVYAKCDYMTLDEALHEKEWNESDWQQDGLPIHGAIWTDKGLIYVAKMNDRGELELC